MNDNLAIGIMTSYKLKERYMSCKNTWTKDFDNVFFIGGDVQDENLIRLPGVGENYGSCYLKQQLGLKYMFEKNNEFDWFCISGCDHILFKNNIMKVLKNYDRNKDILFGEIYTEKIIEGLNTKVFAGGGSFFLSNSLMKKIYPLIDEFYEHWLQISQPVILHSVVSKDWGDVALAYMVKKYFNIDTTHMPGMFSQHPSHYDNPNNFNGVNDVNNLNNPLSFHYIKPYEMESVLNKYGKQQEK